MNKIELTAQEKMDLADMVKSDTWLILLKISNVYLDGCIAALCSMGEHGDFRHNQGMIHGISMFVNELVKQSLPPNAETHFEALESALNARKARE